MAMVIIFISHLQPIGDGKVHSTNKMVLLAEQQFGIFRVGLES